MRRFLDRLIKLYSSIPPMMVDGAIYTCLQGLTFLSTAVSGEDAYKYINPYVLFWLKILFGEGATVLLALKTFRSKAYSEYHLHKAGFDTDHFKK